MAFFYSNGQLTTSSKSRRREGPVVCLVVLSVIAQFYNLGPTLVGAVSHNVGGSYVTSWTNSIGSTNNATALEELYAAWAKSVTISVGDSLIFVYDDLHTVVKVPNKASFDACNYKDPGAVTVSPPDMYAAGPTTYVVSSTDPLYFVCSIELHCSQGQKVAITNIQAMTPSAESPKPSGAARSSSAKHLILFPVSMALLSTLL